MDLPEVNTPGIIDVNDLISYLALIAALVMLYYPLKKRCSEITLICLQPVQIFLNNIEYGHPLPRIAVVNTALSGYLSYLGYFILKSLYYNVNSARFIFIRINGIKYAAVTFDNMRNIGQIHDLHQHSMNNLRHGLEFTITLPVISPDFHVWSLLSKSYFPKVYTREFGSSIDSLVELRPGDIYYVPVENTILGHMYITGSESLFAPNPRIIYV